MGGERCHSSFFFPGLDFSNGGERRTCGKNQTVSARMLLLLLPCHSSCKTPGPAQFTQGVGCKNQRGGRKGEMNRGRRFGSSWKGRGGEAEQPGWEKGLERLPFQCCHCSRYAMATQAWKGRSCGGRGEKRWGGGAPPPDRCC